MAPQPQQVSIAQLNAQIEALILASAYEYENIIYSKTFTDTPGSTISIPVRNTGLLKKFVVEVAAAISGGSGDVQTLQKLGAGNFFSRVQFWDFSNKERINTSGWHLQMIASAKRGRPYGAAFTSDTSLGIASNNNKVQYAPTSINAAASGNNFFAMFEVPVCRSDNDMRGIIDANVTNATARLELTVNPNMFAPTATADTVLSLYKSGSSTKGTLDSYTIKVYQIGYDQVPVDQKTGRSLLPPIDAGVAYMLNNTVETNLAANSETIVSFANNRTFLSLVAGYNNAGTLNEGSDVSSIAFQSANWTRWKETDPFYQMLKNRELFGADLPDNFYHFSFLQRPINTLQAGNVTFNITPSAVSAGATLLLGWESFADLVTVTQGGTIGA